MSDGLRPSTLMFLLTRKIAQNRHIYLSSSELDISQTVPKHGCSRLRGIKPLFVGPIPFNNGFQPSLASSPIPHISIKMFIRASSLILPVVALSSVVSAAPASLSTRDSCSGGTVQCCNTVFSVGPHAVLIPEETNHRRTFIRSLAAAPQVSSPAFWASPTPSLAP